MTIEQYYGRYYEPLREVEKMTEQAIHDCLDDVKVENRRLVKYISSRIKNPDSITEKLKRKNFAPGVDSAINNLCDIIGFRIVVRFIGEIYTVRDLLRKSEKIKILEEKDYIAHSKPSGYRSYHLVIEQEYEGQKYQIEIQLRTMAMDCWASLEHQIKYKKNIDNADLIGIELKQCSDNLLSADATMEAIRNLVQYSAYLEKQNEQQ